MEKIVVSIIFWKSRWNRCLGITQALYLATTPEGKEIMRHRNLVFALILGLFAGFSTYSQNIDFGSKGINGDLSLKGGRKAAPVTPQVWGRITDLGGRSIKAAEVMFFCLDCDQVSTVRTNAFGYYQVSDLLNGHDYLLSIQHKKYLFLIAPDPLTVGPETVTLDFTGELAR
jgi:hypothetical protein